MRFKGIKILALIMLIIPLVLLLFEIQIPGIGNDLLSLFVFLGILFIGLLISVVTLLVEKFSRPPS